jgi:hypothetical protein
MKEKKDVYRVFVRKRENKHLGDLGTDAIFKYICKK